MRTATIALCLLGLASPALAGEYADGAKAYLVANEFCPGVDIPAEKIGVAIYLAAAEMGASEVDDVATILGAGAAIAGQQLKDNGNLDKFCERAVDLMLE